MQTKRSKRTRIRAAKDTAGHGSKKKNRGAGHRGGRGKAGSGKRGDAKIGKVTKGLKYLGKYGFKTLKTQKKAINLHELQLKLANYVKTGKASFEKDVYNLDLDALGFDKLLSKGVVDKKLHLVVKEATSGAIEKVKAAGGNVTVKSENIKAAED